MKIAVRLGPAFIQLTRRSLVARTALLLTALPACSGETTSTPAPTTTATEVGSTLSPTSSGAPLGASTSTEATAATGATNSTATTGATNSTATTSSAATGGGETSATAPSGSETSATDPTATVTVPTSVPSSSVAPTPTGVTAPPATNSDATSPINTEDTDASAPVEMGQADSGLPSGAQDTSPPLVECVPNGRAHNPLVTHIFTADPNAVVYGERIYLYVSHDVDGQDGYDMVDYRGFSSDDLVNWQDHGVLIDTNSLPWAENLYAPGACTKNGKYYLYMPNGGTSIGVARSDNPGGPFVDPIGKALITKSFPNANVPWLFDPACFVDDDGQAYLYFGGGDDGGQNARVIRLNDDMVSLKDTSATTIPTTAFYEASFMHKHAGTYYFSYSSDFSSGHSAALEYLTSNSPMTGFTYQGAFLPNSNINNGNNNHGSIVDFNDKTYLFYHARKLQQELGINKVNDRSVVIQELAYGPNNTLTPLTMSTQDFTVNQLKCLDGFAEVQAETLAAEGGIEVEGKAGETVRVAQISNGDWVGYSQVDFRNGATTLVVRVASAAGGGTIDVSIDDCITGAAGTSLGSCSVVSTGGANTFAELSCPIASASGAHDLCLSFAGNPSFQLDSWHLE